jgi:hypothetical protein
VVDQSVFQTQGSATKQASTYFVKDKNGVVSEVEIGRDQIKPPTPGFYVLKLKAMTAPFEMDGTYGKSKNVRCLFVVKAPGNPNDKRMFSQLLAIAKLRNDGWQPNITAKTAIGQMMGCIRGRPIVEGEPINLLEVLNGEFQAMVNQTTKTGENGVEVYGNIVKDTWQPVAQQAMPVAQPAPVTAAAVGAPSGDPFQLDDDD